MKRPSIPWPRCSHRSAQISHSHRSLLSSSVSVPVCHCFSLISIQSFQHPDWRTHPSLCVAEPNRLPRVGPQLLSHPAATKTMFQQFWVKLNHKNQKKAKSKRHESEIISERICSRKPRLAPSCRRRGTGQDYNLRSWSSPRIR